jgi:acyl transferase domain-containing protein
LSAINSVFANLHQKEKLIVGSVKSNVGHLEACAAIVGIIKAVECLERGQIPPQMHFVTPNPKINFDAIHIPTTVMDWPKTEDGSRRAAVNSFGFGGTNGHVILEHYPTKLGVTDSVDRPYLFKVSASNQCSLEATASAYAKYVEDREPSLADFSHTLLARRSTFKFSTFLTASSHPELIQKLREPAAAVLKKASSVAKVGFVFTGQGAQW